MWSPVERWLTRRPHFEILKNGKPYLTRWWISPGTEERYHARRFRPAILFHRIWESDSDRAPHDHPWWFVSFVVKGWYLENLYDKGGGLVRSVRRGRFSVAFRRSTALHDIGEVGPNTWTVLIVGPKRREWGFMTPGGWVRWDQYVSPGWTETRSIGGGTPKG